MPIDEQLAERTREYLSTRPGYSQKKMFGGLCFLLNGHMCCGINGQDLMLRVGADLHAETLARPGARAMDFTGRPLPARALYTSFGFSFCEPFANYALDPNSVFMTREF